MKNKPKLRQKTIASALLLATSPAWAKTGGSGSGGSGQTPNVSNPFVGKTSPIQIASIELDKASEKKAQICEAPEVTLPPPSPNSVLSLAFEPKPDQTITLQFDISQIPETKDERILLLLYSRCLSPKPQIRTLFSKNKLALDLNDTRKLGTYNVPAIQTAAQPSTRVGTATSPAMQETTLKINIPTNMLAQQLNEGNDTFYFQGALLKKTDLEKGRYNNVNLSQLEAIHVTPKTCPTAEQFSSNVASANQVCEHLPTKTND